ncbi:MAG: NCS2 family permease [Cyanobacteria bacterium J06623_5]
MDGAPSDSLPQKIADYFEFQRLHTSWRTEILAGVTTFVTMAYILVVNPGILSNAIYLETSGDLFDELVIATALSAAIATTIMGLYAKLPFGLAPGMGLNAFFTFAVVLGIGVDWRAALGAVFIEGLIFILLTVTNVRSQIIAAIPDCIKHATTGGIGLFIAYIALQNAGLIVTNEATLTGLGDFQTGKSAIALLGILITAALIARRVTGALLWGILATALFAWGFGVADWPTGLIATPSWPADLFGQAFSGLSALWRLNLWDAANIVFVLLFVDLFDTVGTLAGLGSRAGYIDESGRFPGSEKAMMADAVGTTAGAVLGTSTVTTYIESAAGISEGGRSGATAVVIALLFVASTFFIPLLAGIPDFASAPALIIVGSLMLAGIRYINWDDPAEAISSFLTLLVMPLSFSIAEGLAAGLVTYPLIKLCQGKAGQVSWVAWVLAAIFIAKYIFSP